MDHFEFEKKTLQVKFTKSAFSEGKADDEYYYFEGYGAVFGNKDLGGDVIRFGAFTKTLQEMIPALCYQHWMSQVIGVIDEIKEDANGLFIKCRIPKKHSLGSDVAALIKCGGLKEMSIGYQIIKSEDEGNVRYLIEVKLYEISVVTKAMNPRARITGFKSLDQIGSIRDIENNLLDNGYSSKEAKTLISKIKEFSIPRDVKEKQSERDATNDNNEVLTKLHESNLELKALNNLTINLNL